MWEYDDTMDVYVGGYYTYTYGNQFTVGSHDITVDRLGGFKQQYWASPYPYMPYWIYNVRLWTTGGTMLGASGALYPADGAWAWGDIPDVTLTAGSSYIVAWHCEPESTTTYPYYYPHIGGDSPGAAPEITWDGYRYYPGSDVFPTYGPYTGYYWFCDIDYYWEVVVPNTIEDTASVFVDNVAPIVINPQASVGQGQEGSEVEFTGSFLDPGLDDDWEYRWDWGDGTQSAWIPVSKFSGGVRVLWLHTYSGYEDQIMDDLAAEMGSALIRQEEYDCGPLGNNDAPELDYMNQFDVIIIASNYIPSADVGDRLAEYCAAGGGVVELVAMMHPTYGIGGDWRSDGYSVFSTSSTLASGTSLSIYDPSHPVFDGIAGVVTTFSCTLAVGITSITTGAVLLADYNTGWRAAAVRDENDIGPGSGRVVGLNIFAQEGYFGGQAFKAIANAAFWASQQDLPEPLSMPLTTTPMSHIYADDHPTSVTPSDVFDVQLQVRDDDHESFMVIGGVQDVFDEDFSSGLMPPPGWTESPYTSNWMIYYGALAGGTSPEVRFYWIPYTPGTYRLYSPAIDTTGMDTITVSFQDYLNHFSGPYELRVETSTDATNWDTVWALTNPSAFPARTEEFTTATNIGGPTTYVSWTFDGDPYNLNYWHFDDIAITTFETYTMFGLGSAGCTVEIANVFPVASVPADFTNVVDERVSIDFEGFEISDPAIDELTEAFWYRWDYGDGTPVGPWIWKGTMAPPPLRVLLLNSWTTSEGPEVMNGIQDELEARGFGPFLTLDEYNYYNNPTAPSLSYLLDYDVVLTSTNYYIYTTGLLDDLGDVLADYSDAGGSVIQMVFAGGTSSSGFLGRWYSEDYTPVPYSGNYYGYLSLGDVYDPGHPIMENVGDMSAYYSHTISGVTSGATRLCDYANGNTLCAYTDRDHHAPGGGRIVALNFFPWWSYTTGDADVMTVNAILWAWGAKLPSPTLDTVSHDYGDNGIYTAGLQIIDDDMMWDWAPGDAQPTFTGTGPEEDWISYSYFPVEVLNVDPVISPRMRAEVNLDLVIRTTGEPKNDCTMTLWEGTTALGSVTVYHDGNYKMETLPATLNMGNINDYYVTVEYENADPDGANPTWVFEGRFPSGHNKELKNVFKEDGTLWTIDSSLLKTMLVGEDIVFTAVGADDGSDDLAFDWHFDDGEGGIHVYANADSSMAEGTSQPPEDIFNANPNRDPWFDRAPNTIRSPDMNPIVIVDEISHAFSEGGYYYVALILMDDDVCDGYPSFQSFLNGGGYDMEFMEIDLS
jgi:hypothetical protein